MRANLLAATASLTKDSLGPKRWRYVVKYNTTSVLRALHYVLLYGMRLYYVTVGESRARAWRFTHTQRDGKAGHP